jgi:hypothetical protein
MNTTERRIIVCLLACAIAASGASIFENPHALSAELRRLATSVKEGHRQEVRDALPLAWVVTSEKRDYAIRTAELKSQLESKDDAAAEAWLDQVADQLEFDSQRTAPGAADPRAALSKILSAREFASVRPPGPWERFKAWLGNWIGRLLARLFGYLGPSTGRFVWGLGAVAVVFLALWLYRVLRRGTQFALSLAPVETQAVRTWEQWVGMAREALAQGDFRAAAHAAYWAGVARLQDERLLPEDTTLTAREYLRLIPDHRQAHDPFAALTAGLERFWYANRPATSADVQELFGNMEALGCRPD